MNEMEDDSVFQVGILTAVWDFKADKRDCFIENLKIFLGINK